MKIVAMLACGLTVIVLVPVASGQDNNGEKLFRNMEKRLKNAKAFEVSFTYQLQGKTTKGSLLLTSANEARLKLTGPFFFGIKRSSTFELISDGKQLKTKGAKLVIASNGQAGVEPGGQTEGQTPKSFHNVLVASVSRAGIGATVLGLPYLIREEFDPDGVESRMTVYDFKAGSVEKVGERQARVVRYRHGKGGNDDAELTVWLDTETGMPVQRILALPRGSKIRITESYNSVGLNPKFDAGVFELPK